MKTIRLLLLFVLLLFALLATGHAAVGSPDDPPRVYLPLILKDWRPISQTRFLNASGELLLSLSVDGTPRVTEDQPLEDGGSITIQLPPGEHSYTVTLGVLDSNTVIRHYRWDETFTQEPLQTMLERIELPSLAAVLSGYNESMQWENRESNPKPNEPTRFCFFSDGSYHVFFDDPCPQQVGHIEEAPQTNDTRNFKLVDPNGVVQFTASLIPNIHLFSEFFNLNPGEEITIPIGMYGPNVVDPTCSPVPDDCPLNPD